MKTQHDVKNIEKYGHAKNAEKYGVFFRKAKTPIQHTKNTEKYGKIWNGEIQKNTEKYQEKYGKTGKQKKTHPTYLRFFKKIKWRGGPKGRPHPVYFCVFLQLVQNLLF